MPSALNTLNLLLMAVLLVAALSVHAGGLDQKTDLDLLPPYAQVFAAP